MSNGSRILVLVGHMVAVDATTIYIVFMEANTTHTRVSNLPRIQGV
jgi:hypothetical protein